MPNQLWLYRYDGDELRVSSVDPDSPDHECGKNEFSIPCKESNEVRVRNTIVPVLQAAGVLVMLCF